MSHDATVSAGDIARLADVGRAAVSNWRRRHDDFPRPVGGTASSPLFSLREVESWLRRNGKSYEVSSADLVWQRLKGTRDDLRLGEAVAEIGAFLLYLHREPESWKRLADDDHIPRRLPAAVAAATTDLPASTAIRELSGAPSSEPPALRLAGDPDLIRLAAGLAAERGPLDAFDVLVARYVEAHSRRLPVTRSDIAELMVALSEVPAGGGTVLDPACGIGTLPIAALTASDPPIRVLGQDSDGTAARITAVRLLLREVPAEIVCGDSLLADAFPGGLADAALCDPPFNERAWGYEELTGDPRWEYGLPPRGEPELAWVQHCLARVRPGGTVAILMPAAAAGRRPGKRIRGNLLRAGALRAVLALAPGGPDLWLLRRPDGLSRPPSQLLVADAAGDPRSVVAAWRAFADDPDPGLSGPPAAREADGAGPEAAGACRTVRIIDLLDDEVDLSPARHLARPAGDDLRRGFTVTLERFRAASVALSAGPPALELLAERHDLPSTTIGELVRAGLITVSQAPPRMEAGAGELPVLTADDVLSGGPPSGRTSRAPGLVDVEAGDVVATPAGAVRVVDEGGFVLGPHLQLYRVDPARLDACFLAGCLRLAARSAASRPHAGSSRIDPRRARIPRLPLAEQRRYGEAFRELLALEDRLRETAELGETLVRLAFDGLADGHLRPLA